MGSDGKDLANARRTFLYEALKLCKDNGYVTADGLIDHFTKLHVLSLLKTEERVDIFKPAGMHQNVALSLARMAPSAWMPTLIAADINGRFIIETVGLDRLVEVLDNDTLWSYAVRDNFELTPLEKTDAYAIARTCIGQIILLALRMELLTAIDVLKGNVSSELRQSDRANMGLGHWVLSLTEHGNVPDASSILTGSGALDHVSLPTLWREVVIHRIALPLGLHASPLKKKDATGSTPAAPATEPSSAPTAPEGAPPTEGSMEAALEQASSTQTSEAVPVAEAAPVEAASGDQPVDAAAPQPPSPNALVAEAAPPPVEPSAPEHTPLPTVAAISDRPIEPDTMHEFEENFGALSEGRKPPGVSRSTPPEPTKTLPGGIMAHATASGDSNEPSPHTRREGSGAPPDGHGGEAPAPKAFRGHRRS